MPEAESTSLVVNIFGKNYALALEPGQSADRVREVAQLADQGMRQVYLEYRSPSPVQTAVLAALNLVDELFQLQNEYRQAEFDIAQRTSRLATSLGRLFEQVRVSPTETRRS